MKEIKNFAIIEGKATIQNGEVTFKEVLDKENEEKSITRVELRTDANFSNGIIEFKAKFKDDNSGCVVALKRNNGEIAIIGCSKDAQKFIVPNKESYKVSGSLSNYDITQELSFKIEVSGSNISLYVNNILMVQGESTLNESPIEFRLSGTETKLYNVKYRPIKPKVFIVMQFSDEYNTLYNDVIKPVTESYDLECLRADEFYTSSPIIKDIIDNIKESYIIIAEITPDNPNVFYEIGYAHAINKPTILLCDKKRDKLPFDVSGFRTLFYENSIGGKNKVERDLKKFIESILK
ncbi:hypothetical protein ACU8DI_15230 [Psychroserpens sp. BH13MA-6]